MNRHLIIDAIATLLMAVCVSCHNGHDDGGEAESDAAVLTIYVYSPEHPLTTRANTGYVDASYAERQIKTLQIWVFKTGTNELVGYLNPNDTDRDALNSGSGTTLQMIVSQSFGMAPQNVDVYVLANVTTANSGLAFGETTTRTELEAALMGQTGTRGGNSDPFGLTTLTTDVPTDGLPMSGVLRNQPVTGESPVLRVGTRDRLATVQLVRMVSKVRFVFSRSADSEEAIEISDVSLTGNMVPVDEYVFLDGAYDERTAHLTGYYVADSRSLMEQPITDADLGKPEDPGYYAYTSQESQAYERLIGSGITAGELSNIGPFYLRETDKKLGGTITYKVNGESRIAPFSVSAAGDFSRNHTWIVYAHYGTSTLEVVSVEVLDWTQRTSDPHVVYNW